MTFNRRKSTCETVMDRLNPLYTMAGAAAGAVLGRFAFAASSALYGRMTAHMSDFPAMLLKQAMSLDLMQNQMMLTIRDYALVGAFVGTAASVLMPEIKNATSVAPSSPGRNSLFSHQVSTQNVDQSKEDALELKPIKRQMMGK